MYSKIEYFPDKTIIDNWFYDANVTPSLAMEYEDELYFNYDNTNVPTSWNSVALFYHDNSLSP